MTAHTILVIGAGIGGLTTALAFARQGFAVDVVEQATTLSEVGAGLQVSPNASRILVALGLGEALQRTMVLPRDIALASGRSLRAIARVPCGGFAADRWGAPYGVMHRADLQALLLEAVIAHPACRVHLEQPVQSSDITTLHARIGTPRPDLIVAADGVWSQSRKLIPQASMPRFSGQVAWRFQLDASAAGSVIDTRNVTAFLGARTHLVAYPLENGTVLNMVAIAGGKNLGESWAAQEAAADRTELLQAFAGWDPRLVSLLRTAPRMTRWPLFAVADGRWSDDAGMVMIGDAAHAMTPFAAQGAAMAIEDGYELAHACGHAGKDFSSAIERYETHRRSRLTQVRRRGAFNRFAYHASGPVRLGRDLVLGLRKPESLAADLDWLYGYRATGL
ncbi:FAD-dependent monooxygenase [Hoeflea sp. YIM 152468]|uniref:FAD-dependent monooxygenase n=1 Tax=Hoeflea sp. YIM 152468 TaxID=3031759 RepID=UPI0023DCA35A|nr:FAD-dependent monooxygenase [Hoeflea sp. YIM 152468]MDF1610029.1 FAD-dependent monooxygenase [Hoeflea sp. YIM 152468]